VPDHRVECEVVVPETLREEIPDANAFRVLQDGGHEFLLDFLAWPGQEEPAVIVQRVRVHRDVLQSVVGRLKTSIQEPAVVFFSVPLEVG